MRALVAAAVLVVLGSCVPANSYGPWTPTGPPGGEVPAVFGDDLAFGLRNDPNDLGWMVESGVPWAARYTYLAGGVNTGAGWATLSSVPGTYASEYAEKSAAAGYIPIFTYYQLQQSRPARGNTEADRDYSNLADPATMRAYYDDFTLLMRSLARAGRVVVHVEPDLWGYLEQRNADPTAIYASVASSGSPAVATLPNTAAGFAEALLDLRTQYAPNVLLAIHASAWGAGRDPVVSTADFDPVPLARATARFLRSLDKATHGWDLVFHDMTDRDAAFPQPTAGRRGWWDPADRTFPDFGRWLAWVHALSVGLDRRVVLWQVPLGNQRFRSLDNTPGHYQDNKAEYFLAHAGLLAAAGVAAVLFGPGIDGATWYTDARHDGVTNPDPVKSFGCDVCNLETARYADDDGGFLRTEVGTYYRSRRVPLPRG